MTTNNSRSGLAVDLTATNRWLGEGETVKETDTGKVKIGPGLWNDLDYETTGASQSSTPEFLYRFASGSQVFQNATPPYAEEGDPANGADKGRITVTVFTEDVSDGIHPNMVWHADTNEVEFLAGGEAWVQCEADWGAGTAGGAGFEVAGLEYELAAGGTHRQVLFMGPAVPLTVETSQTDDHTNHSSGAVNWSGSTSKARVEAGDRWRVVARVGSTETETLFYADLGVYFTAGY